MIGTVLQRFLGILRFQLGMIREDVLKSMGLRVDGKRVLMYQRLSKVFYRCVPSGCALVLRVYCFSGQNDHAVLAFHCTHSRIKDIEFKILYYCCWKFGCKRTAHYPPSGSVFTYRESFVAHMGAVAIALQDR